MTAVLIAEANVGHLRGLDFVTIGIYGLVVLFIGWWCSRRQESTEEYFVAGRGMGSLIVGISMIATLLSTISYLTTPGEMIKNGPGVIWGMLNFPISFCILGYLVIPRIMKHKVVSGYELLHARFGMTVRQTASVLFILVRIIWMGFIIFTCSMAVAKITGVHLTIVLALVGLVGTVYTVMGGVRAVMITDVIQFIILFGGGLLAIGMITHKCGGFSWFPDWDSAEIAALNWKEVKVFSLNPFDRVTAVSAVFAGCFFWVSAATSDQVVIQRYLCTRDAKTARRSLGFCMIGDAGIGIVLYAVGFALLGLFLRFPELLADPSKSIVEQADQLFPHFIGKVLPPGITGLLVAALFAAAMSSLDSGISAIGSVLMTDFKELFAGGLGDDQKRLMRRAKWTSLGIGIAAIALSYSNFLVIRLNPDASLWEIGFKISEFFIAPLFVLFALVFFTNFSTPAGAWSAIIVGFLTGVLFTYWKPILEALGIPTPVFSMYWIAPAATVCSFTAGAVVSLFTKPRVQSDTQ